MSREALFAAVRPFAPGQKFTENDVAALDAIADRWGLGVSGAMAPSRGAVELMHEFEGCRLDAYPDPGSADGNPWTIGYGSTGPGISPGVRWTQQQCDDRFLADLAKFGRGVSEALAGAATTQNQFDALTSFAYNVGLGSLKSSTVLRKHRAGDYAGAQAAFSMWNKNDGKVMAGLTRRRAAEAALYGKRS